MRYLSLIAVAAMCLCSTANAQDATPGFRKVCDGRRCWFERIVPQVSQTTYSVPVAVTYALPVEYLAMESPVRLPSEYMNTALATGEAAHTPMSEVVRVIGLLSKPQIAFVDFGCGYDARWCVAAAERWGCKCIGIEIDPGRASAARDRVRNLGLDHLITIVDGDAVVVPISADVGVAYLFPEVLARLKPRLESFRAFASYIHQPPGMNCTKNGDTWIYQRQVQAQQAATGAVWGGAIYNQRVCNNPHCAMCNSIGRQLGQR